MANEKIGCLDALTVHFSGAKALTENGRQLYKRHTSACSCVGDMGLVTLLALLAKTL